MPGIKRVTIIKINLGSSLLRKYQVEYYSGIIRVYGIPPDTVKKYVRENVREYQKIKFTFEDRS